MTLTIIWVEVDELLAGVDWVEVEELLAGVDSELSVVIVQSERGNISERRKKINWSRIVLL